MENLRNKHFTKEFLIEQWNNYFELLKQCPRLHYNVLEECKSGFDKAIQEDDYEGLVKQYQKVRARVRYHRNKNKLGC